VIQEFVPYAFREDDILEFSSVAEPERRAMLEPVIMAAAIRPPVVQIPGLSAVNGGKYDNSCRLGRQHRSDEELAVDPQPMIRQKEEKEAEEALAVNMRCVLHGHAYFRFRWRVCIGQLQLLPLNLLYRRVCTGQLQLLPLNLLYTEVKERTEAIKAIQ
jgi:hypothetical protein